ncbi:hypothetical protein [Deinococcus rubellus]|uniref:hypothetical protein n=1 Tax=Deinococcus rubellus TaxID=1889240 RepID=UPI0031EBA703
MNLSLDTWRAGRQPCIITITAVHEKQQANIQNVGVCIQDQYNLRFMRYQTSESLDKFLPHVLEIALSKTPALTDILLTTSHKLLWQPVNYSKTSLEFIQRTRCKIKLAYPLPHDLGSTLATLSANGITGPRMMDYHFYTASVTDERNAYVAALLWGKNYAHLYVQTLPTTNLAMAEAAATEWGLQTAPRNSHVMIYNSNPAIGQVWNRTKDGGLPPELRHALRRVGKQLKIRGLRFSTYIEKPHNPLDRVVRAIVGGLYSGMDVDVRQHSGPV